MHRRAWKSTEENILLENRDGSFSTAANGKYGCLSDSGKSAAVAVADENSGKLQKAMVALFDMSRMPRIMKTLKLSMQRGDKEINMLRLSPDGKFMVVRQDNRTSFFEILWDSFYSNYPQIVENMPLADAHVAVRENNPFERMVSCVHTNASGSKLIIKIFKYIGGNDYRKDEKIDVSDIDMPDIEATCVAARVAVKDGYYVAKVVVGHKKGAMWWDVYSGVNGELGLDDFDATVNCVEMTLDGNYVITGDSNNMVQKWDLRTGEVVFATSLSDPPIHLSLIPNSPNILAATRTKLIRLNTTPNKSTLRY